MKNNMRGFIDPLTLGFLISLVGTGIGIATAPANSFDTMIAVPTVEVVDTVALADTDETKDSTITAQ